jgi:processive 1,2-diacylglycerol beta-glucosyltransferase
MFADVLHRLRPQLVVSTIGGAAALAGDARSLIGEVFLNAVVLTDYRAHRHWARTQTDLYVVPTAACKTDLESNGVSSDRIEIVGIPVQPGIHRLNEPERKNLRTRLGLSSDLMMLVSGGSTAPYHGLKTLMRVVSHLDRPIDVVTFAEKGPMQTFGRVRLWRLGFRDDHLDWLCASDLVIGKTGGLTVAEASAAGEPWVIFEPVPGQEVANAQHLVDGGAGLWVRSEAELLHAITRLLDSPIERERMAQAAVKLGRPDATAKIVELFASRLDG